MKEGAGPGGAGARPSSRGRACAAALQACCCLRLGQRSPLCRPAPRPLPPGTSAAGASRACKTWALPPTPRPPRQMPAAARCRRPRPCCSRAAWRWAPSRCRSPGAWAGHGAPGRGMGRPGRWQEGRQGCFSVAAACTNHTPPLTPAPASPSAWQGGPGAAELCGVAGAGRAGGGDGPARYRRRLGGGAAPAGGAGAGRGLGWFECVGRHHEAGPAAATARSVALALARI